MNYWNGVQKISSSLFWGWLSSLSPTIWTVAITDKARGQSAQRSGDNLDNHAKRVQERYDKTWEGIAQWDFKVTLTQGKGNVKYS